ncbi:transposable element Tcb2 transposase [Trichonephila clavipes]|uniref:Transposable element Tcb2 transposase n=1 Tax=Trichonephila clavipes TaxID=2585209 RepID=A0A8X6UY84_TRICX|nr:transposable element Tcb2 transposase [Trichonephila clavipes]
MPFTRRLGSGRHRQTSHREDPHIVRNARVQPTASIGTPVFSRTLRRRLAEGLLGSRHPLRVLSLMLTHRRFCLKWCHARGNWTATEWNQVVFSDESKFNLSSDDNRVRALKPLVKRLNHNFALQRHNAPTVGVMV